MECRSGCAACCIAPSISLPLPNMQNGKRAGEYCINLDPKALICNIWGTENYPELCDRFTPEEAICGTSRDDALQILTFLEQATKP